ncbi:hypothetical protein [Oceanobacillus locisalsi]|uniref:YfhD family protein n=1 Tax=Oceanobacillus locisalsi TaxID=546107 RepID=A0ABW3NMI1_9BACI
MAVKMRNAPTAKGKDARRFLEKVKKNSELMHKRRRADGDSRGKKIVSNNRT